MEIAQLKSEFQKYRVSVMETVKAYTAGRHPIPSEAFVKWNISLLNEIEKLILSVQGADGEIDLFDLGDWRHL